MAFPMVGASSSPVKTAFRKSDQARRIAFRKMLSRHNLPPNAVELARILDDHTPPQHAECWLSIKTLTLLLGRSRSTYFNAMRCLELVGLVERVVDASLDSKQRILLSWRTVTADVSASLNVETGPVSISGLAYGFPPPDPPLKGEIKNNNKTRRWTADRSSSFLAVSDPKTETTLPEEVRRLVERAARLFPHLPTAGLANLIQDEAMACASFGGGFDWIAQALGEAEVGKAREWIYVQKTLANWRRVGQPTPRRRPAASAAAPAPSGWRPTEAERQIAAPATWTTSALAEEARVILAGEDVGGYRRRALDRAGYRGDDALRVLAATLNDAAPAAGLVQGLGPKVEIGADDSNAVAVLPPSFVAGAAVPLDVDAAAVATDPKTIGVLSSKSAMGARIDRGRPVGRKLAVAAAGGELSDDVAGAAELGGDVDPVAAGDHPTAVGVDVFDDDRIGRQYHRHTGCFEVEADVQRQQRHRVGRRGIGDAHKRPAFFSCSQAAMRQVSISPTMPRSE